MTLLRQLIVGPHGKERQGFHGSAPADFILKQGETEMGDKGKKDKGKREVQKKAQLDPKEKRRLKKEKKAAK